MSTSTVMPRIWPVIATALLLCGVVTAAIASAASTAIEGRVLEPLDPSGSEAVATSPEIAPTTSSEEVVEPLSESMFDDVDHGYAAQRVQAAKVGGWDYEDCAELEIDGALTSMGCERAVEVAFEAEGGDLVLMVLVLKMTDEAKAEAATDVAETDFEPHDQSYLADVEYSRWIREAVDEYVLITMCTADSSVDEFDADRYLTATHDYQATELLFR